jgi:hypothetical protein
MPPKFPYTEVKSLSRWSNFHGTVTDRRVPVFCTPDAMLDAASNAPRRLARHAKALTAILDHCHRNDKTLRVMGSRWSLSNIVTPGDVAIDPAMLNLMVQIPERWLTAKYRRERTAKGYAPIFAQGGTTLSRINRQLAQRELALQTTGASDGHRIAGCIATGTHGSAISIGAVHDTVLGVHLYVGPKRSVLVQPSSAACGASLARWLTQETGLPTEDLRDDAIFAATLVSLGSLGVVHGVVMEAAPLYALETRVVARAADDPDVWHAVRTLDTRAFHPDIRRKPYHVEVVLNPYPTPGKDGAYVILMWKRSARGMDPSPPGLARPDAPSDVMELIGRLMAVFNGPIGSGAAMVVLGDQLASRYRPMDHAPALPGHVFGPTSSPPGGGTCTEIVVDQRDAEAAVQVIQHCLARDAAHGSLLLGAIALRFVPMTKALLGMNIHRMSCYIELPSIRNSHTLDLYRRCWDALEAEGIAYTCHWGQVHGLTPERVERYFGDRVGAWKRARAELLPSPTSRRVFASPLLAEVGLDG